MRGTAVMLSARLGGTDGVSIEAAKWEGALARLGFDLRRVAGEFPDDGRDDDVALPWLAIEPPRGLSPVPAQLAAAVGGAALVVVENLCSLPLNLPASCAAVEVLADHHGRVAFHHHDLPWQRERLAHITDFPPRRPGSLHVAINDRSRDELAERGIEAVTIRNAFDLDSPAGNRDSTRKDRRIGADDLVVLQPTRAIARKDVPAGIRLAEGLRDRMPGRRVRYWLTGLAEEGYGPTLERVLAAATVPVTRGRVARAADAYAAADAVVLPSTWEGFGNPVIESMAARRPLAVRRYAVLEEIARLGFQWFPADDPGPLADWLQAPDPALLDANLALARRHFSLADLPARIEDAFAAVGWTSW